MKYGLESLQHAVKNDTESGENCFNKKGCDQEFYRTVTETNPKMTRYRKTKCIHVSKCFHKYCDKYKWIIERAKHYAEKNGKDYKKILEIWEKNRTYWYMSYYQDGKMPLNGKNKYLDEDNVKEEIKRLESEAKTFFELSETLTLEHQQSTKDHLIQKSTNLDTLALENQARLELHEIMTFDS